MISFNTTAKVVKEVLEEVPAARDNDTRLYFEIAVRIGYKQNSNIVHKPFGLVVLNLDAYGLPTYEDVKRAKRKIQFENKELAHAYDDKRIGDKMGINSFLLR